MMTLKKAKELLFKGSQRYFKKKETLSAALQGEAKKLLSSLQEALLAQNKKEAIFQAKQLKKFMHLHMKRNPLEYLRETSLSLGFALVVVVLIRQMWFELYEVPTGSMRPTIQEHDRLLVSKSTYGINIPLSRGHLYFDENLVKRDSIVIFTGAGLDIKNLDTMYFYLFPGKKQFVKRLIGKGGDKLYFYGGKVYGVNHLNEDISHEMDTVDHIPFISLEGKMISSPEEGSVMLCQMNEPVAQLFMTASKKLRGKMLLPNIDHYYDLWGFKNYAVARLITKEANGPLFLELTHHPDIQQAYLHKLPSGGGYPMLGTSKSYIPLKEEQEDRLFDSLYTGRFLVSKGRAAHYGRAIDQYSPVLDVPDGTYEFSEGTAFQIFWGGIRRPLDKSHPLYLRSPERLQLFFNLGIAFDTRFNSFLPSRFAFWRDHNLYVMGHPFLMQEDPLLTEFLANEHLKQPPYLPFEDLGPPLTPDGKINLELLEKEGLKIPEKHYLVLGDNYSDSGDSRDFGFVPEENLRGSPALTFFPPGRNFGPLNQPTSPLFTLPKGLVWGTFLLFFALWKWYNRKNEKLPIHFD